MMINILLIAVVVCLVLTILAMVKAAGISDEASEKYHEEHSHVEVREINIE